ncbi:hypothetical protein KR018_007532 [Drosophila ironensis]|nr:hypothetical protein KR018_007532 [Drosophila ironensis]
MAAQYSYNGHHGDNLHQSVDVAPEVESKKFHFSKASIRRGFAWKVFGILLLQLATTLFVLSAMIYNSEVKYELARNPRIVIISLIETFMILIVLVRNEELRRQTSMNFASLAVLTVSQSICIAVTACHIAATEILMAVSALSLVCLGLMLFALQPKYDFTPSFGLLVTVVALMFFFVISHTYVTKDVMMIIAASIYTMILSGWLLYDIHKMIGGKHKHEINPEEYVFASISLYTDVIDVFTNFVEVIGGKDSR